MTSRLSTDTLNQMTPLLGSLARLIAGGVSPTEAQLQTLLLGADLEDEPGALEELKRWQRLLTVLQQQPTRENRQATVEALRLRGLPEAPVLLAVDLVMGSAPASSPAPPSLTASVERLDLGVLPPGQGATAELEVQGGPGQIVAESDLVWVTPQHFGPGPTRIRVEVRPMQSGVLWTTLKLITASETLEVPVVAQWVVEEQHPGTPPSELAVPGEKQPRRRRQQPKPSQASPISVPLGPGITERPPRRQGQPKPSQTHPASLSTSPLDTASYPAKQSTSTLLQGSLSSPAGPAIVMLQSRRRKSRWAWIAVGLIILTILILWSLWQQSEEQKAEIAWQMTLRATEAAQNATGTAEARATAYVSTATAVAEAIQATADAFTTQVGSPVLAGTPLPQSLELISPINAQQIAMLAYLDLNEEINHLAWSPDGRLLAIASPSGIHIYDTDTLREIRLIKTNDAVKSIAFTPDGQTLAAGSWQIVQLLRASDGALLRTLEEHKGWVPSIAFSPDGKTLASVSDAVRLWNIENGRLIYTLLEEVPLAEGINLSFSGAHTVSFSPDGKYIASGSESGLRNGVVFVWQAADGTLVYKLSGHTDEVQSVAFSPNGQILASGSRDKSLKLWLIVNGTFVQIGDGAFAQKSLYGHTDWIWNIAFSPDSKILSSGSADGTVRLWLVTEGILLKTIAGHTKMVTSVSFSPNGRILASGGRDGAIILWGIRR